MKISKKSTASVMVTAFVMAAAVPTLGFVFSDPGTVSKPCPRLSYEEMTSLVTPSSHALASAEPTHQVPNRVVSGKPDLVGSVVACSDGAHVQGLYSIVPGSPADMNLIVGDVAVKGGAVEIDGVYYSTTYMDLFGFTIVLVQANDIQTGELHSIVQGEIQTVAKDLALDPTDGTVYGIFYTSSGNALQLGTITYGQNSARTQSIANLTEDFAGLACDSRGVLYGLVPVYNSLGKVTDCLLVTVDKETASLTEVGLTGRRPAYPGSATIDPLTDRMYWTVYNEDEMTLCEVDLATGETTTVCEMPDQVTGLVARTPVAMPEAPAAAEILSWHFSDRSVEGSIEFRLPDTLYNGETASGEIGWEILANSQQLLSGTGSAGQTVSESVTLPNPGDYYITVRTSNANGRGPKTAVTAEVGKSFPQPAQPWVDYTDGVAEVGWKPVANDYSGTVIDASDVTYTVLRQPGNILVAENISVNTVAENIPNDGDAQRFYYEVRATYDGMTTAAQTSYFCVGSYDVPYVNGFENKEISNDFKILDANGDGSGWMWYDGEMAATYSSENFMDDWMFSPGLRLEGGKVYEFSCVAHAKSDALPEIVEIKYGRNPKPEAMTGELVKRALIKEASRELTGIIVADEDGVYNVGIHGISAPDMYMLFIDDFKVSGGVSADAPAIPASLKLLADPETLVGSGQFKTPSKNLADGKLESLDRVEVWQGDRLVTAFEQPAKSKTLEFTDNLSAEGLYLYEIVAINTHGESPALKGEVYAGYDIPCAPSEVKAAETMNPGEVHIEWTSVCEDVRGNNLDASRVTYTLYQNNGMGMRIVADQLVGNQYTFASVDGDQRLMQYAVAACTAKGEGTRTESAVIHVGTAMKSLTDSFVDGTPEIDWIMDASSNAQWIVCTDYDMADIESYDDDNGFLVHLGQQQFEKGHIISPKVEIPLDNAELKFHTFNILGGIDDMNVLAVSVCPRGETEFTEVSSHSIFELGDADDWVEYTADLSEWAGQTVQIRIDVKVVTFGYTIIDNIRLTDGGSSVQSLTQDSFTAIGGKGVLTVGGSDKTVRIFSISGVLVGQLDPRATQDISLPAGIYIVCSGDATKRVTIK